MITSIKAEKIVISNGFLGEKVFTPVDITNQLEMPILDTAQFDNVLDTTQISLLNSSKEPLKPFTRIKLTITDTLEDDYEDEYIYRFVENDIVTNVVAGTHPIYRHNISLIEITKLLERRVVDNLTFTNYLDDAYGTENVIKFQSNGFTLDGFAGWNNHFVSPELQGFTYNLPNRFIGPYRMLYMSGYEIVDNTTIGALQVVANGTSSDPNQAFDNLTQIELQNVTPTQATISVGDYVKYIDHTVDNTISTNISINIKVRYATTLFFSWVKWWHYKNLNLTEYYVTKPDNTIQNLTTDGNFTFEQTGTYTFRQFYTYKNENNVTMASNEFLWSITVVDNLTFIPQAYTVLQVLERLLDVFTIRRKDIDEPFFVIDEAIKDKLNSKLSPEFNLTQGTLFEALQQLGDFMHAIPRLIPSVTYEYEYDTNGNITTINRNDYSKWNTITFDFLGGTEQYNNDNYSIIDQEHPMDEYATNFVSNVQNATQTNYDGGATIVEPFMGGFLSTRTESSNFEISNNDCIFKTRKPIRSLLEVNVYCNGVVKNIYSNIVEQSKFITKKSYTDAGDIYNNKAFYLYYTKGKNNIYNLSYLRPNQTFAGALTNSQAIKNILGLDENVNVENYIKDLAVQIKYVPFESFKVKQYKSNFDTESEDVTLFFNQQSNEVDIEAYGENLSYSLLKIGNKKLTKTQYFKHLRNAPHCGLITQDNYYAFLVNREIYCFSPVKVTTNWSKDFNQLFSYDGVKKTKREYEIDSNESTNRNPDYQEFCNIDTTLDVADIFSDDSLIELQTYITNRLATLGFGTQAILNQIASKLSNQNITYKPISFAIIKTIGVNRAGSEEKHCFLLPVSSNAMGKAIVLHFSMDDNYSAGTYAINGNDVEDNDNVNSYAIEDYIPYGNEFGRFDYMAVGYGSDNPIANFNSNVKANSKLLYKVNETNINTNEIMIDFMNNPFVIDKDSREQISLTTQLNFGSTNSKIIVGSALTHTTPLTGNTSIGYKYVLFTEKPNKFDENINLNNIYNLGTPTTEIQNETKSIKINSMTACIDAAGYGIIDKANRLCVYVDEKISNNSQTKPIYLMFRGKI